MKKMSGVDVALDVACAICQEPMKSEAYKADLEQGPESDAFRLSCKHAFHSSCLILAFRTSASTVCPCCRSTEGQTITRGRYSLHITEIDSEEEEEIDVMELMESDQVLRAVRSQNPVIRDLRSNLKKSRKEYNVLRDKLRHGRREHVSKALKQFRDESRDEFRDVQSKLIKNAEEVFKAEKDAYIEMTSLETYEDTPWQECHEAEGQGAQFKINVLSSRHTDPWNSSFWYA
jgi:hypothetical protein